VAWSEPLSIYCERADASFWAEPVNALTNLAFLVAAGAAYLAWRRSEERDRFALALIGVTLAIGAGSFAFHTLATRGAVLLDVIPIAIFVYGYLLFGLRRIFCLAARPALAIVAGFAITSQAFAYALPAGTLNGSGEYLPPLAALMAVGLSARSITQRRLILSAGAIFTCSLFLRTVDREACALFPLGTHFLWHLLNAAVLYLLLRSAIAGRDVHIPS
jgi:4-amino-4-deoxy-L-arabinose transferase-like glycosyltransferase